MNAILNHVEGQEPVGIGTNGSIGKEIASLLEALAHLDSSVQGLEEKAEPFLTPVLPPVPKADKEQNTQPPKILEHSKMFYAIREAIIDIYRIERNLFEITKRLER